MYCNYQKLLSAFVSSRIDWCNILLFGSTHEVTSHIQRIQYYASGVILRIPNSSDIATHLKSLHFLPVKVSSSPYKIACLYYHCHSSTAPSCNSLICCGRNHSSSANLSPAHTPSLFSLDLLRVRQHLVIARFLLFLLHSGKLFQMMSGVIHDCHHLNLVWRNTYFDQFT